MLYMFALLYTYKNEGRSIGQKKYAAVEHAGY
jgi:hypothetical protein